MKLQFVGTRPKFLFTFHFSMESQGKPEPIYIPAQQIIQGDVQHSNIEQQQQIIYVELKYKPEQNYRHLSYAVIVLGVLIYFVSIFTFSGSNSYGVFWGTLRAVCPFQLGYSLMQHFTRVNLTGKLRLDNRIQAQIRAWRLTSYSE